MIQNTWWGNFFGNLTLRKGQCSVRRIFLVLKFLHLEIKSRKMNKKLFSLKIENYMVCVQGEFHIQRYILHYVFHSCVCGYVCRVRACLRIVAMHSWRSNFALCLATMWDGANNKVKYQIQYVYFVLRKQLMGIGMMANYDHIAKDFHHRLVE